MEQALKANLWKMRLHTLVQLPITIAIPVLVLFWQNHGLSLTEVMTLQAIFSIAIVGLEVPSGYFADLFGRKKSMIYGTLFYSTGMLLYCFVTGFWGFLSAELAMALGISLFSGADSSLIYDSLTELKREKEFNKIWGSIIATSIGVMIFYNLLGGFLADWDLRYTFYAAFPISILSLLMAFTYHEPKRHKLIVEKGYFGELLRILKEEVWKKKALRRVFILSSLLWPIGYVSVWMYNPYFELSGLDVIYFGAAFAAMNVISALSAKYAHFFEKKLGAKWLILIMSGLTALSYFAMSQWAIVWGFVFTFGQQITRGVSRVVFPNMTHKLTSSDIRATVVSANNMSWRLVYAVALPLMGWVADVYTLQNALFMMGVIAVIFGLSFGLLSRKSAL